MGWHPPPKEICAKSQLTIVKELLLHAVLFFQVVNVRLIVLKGLDLFLAHLIGKESKKQTFYKC